MWIACTDADSIVPADWLVAQLGYARSGAEMVLGTVVPDPDELAAGLLAAWRLRHTIDDGHPHVHGANMGIRGDMYLTAGGFQDVPTHEDVLLSAAVRSAGGLILSVGASPVITSGRTDGRAPGGMAQYLREIGSRRMPPEVAHQAQLSGVPSTEVDSETAGANSFAAGPGDTEAGELNGTGRADLAADENRVVTSSAEAVGS